MTICYGKKQNNDNIQDKLASVQPNLFLNIILYIWVTFTIYVCLKVFYLCPNLTQVSIKAKTASLGTQDPSHSM